MMSSVLACLVVIVNGLAVGIMASTVIGIVPFMLAASYTGYVQMVQFLWPRFDPIMPGLNGAALLLDVALAALARTDSHRLGFASAAALLAVVIGISITRNVPINRLIGRLDPTLAPADWPQIDPRRRWRQWNFCRTGVALAAFVMNAATAVALG